MKIKHLYVFLAMAAFAAASFQAACAASFSTMGSLQLTTADLSAQGINITWSAYRAELNGFANGTATFFAASNDVFVGSPGGPNSLLNLTINTICQGTANGFGSAFAEATNRHAVSFFHSSAVQQTFQVNWNYSLAAAISFVSPQSANCTSSARITDPTSFTAPPYFSEVVQAFNPSPLSVKQSNSSSITRAVPSKKSIWLYAVVHSRGFTQSERSSPEPFGIIALGIDTASFMLLKRRKQ